MVVKGVRKKTKFIFQTENRTRTVRLRRKKRGVHYATLILNARLVIISFHVTSLLIVARIEISTGVFPGRMCSDHRKKWLWTEKTI